MRPRPRSPLVALAAAVALTVPAGPPAPQAHAATTIFRLEDPRGDDHGDGSLIYPRRDDMQPGDLDLVAFAAERLEEETRFELTFARTIRRPGPAPVDISGTPRSEIVDMPFYTFNVDVYVDTDRERGSGEQGMLPGRKAQIDPAHAWERVIVLAPRPDLARSSMRSFLVGVYEEEAARGEGRAAGMTESQIRAAAREEVETLTYYVPRARVSGPKISFTVPDGFFGGRPASAGWSYVVAVAGAEIQQRLRLPLLGPAGRDAQQGMILPIFPGRPADGFGGGREDDPYQPPLVDVLVPAGEKQERILLRYSISERRPVRLPGVVPAEEVRR